MSNQETLKCMVVDDEPHAIEILELYIQKTPFLHLHKKESDPWAAISFLKNEKVDILFLDIQMEGLTGLQVLDVLEHQPAVVFTTAYEQYALKGYEYKIADYLLKPFSYDRFLKAVSNIQKSISPNVENEPKAEIENPTAVPVDQTHILIKGDAKNKFHRLKISDIKFIEGLKNYVKFNCTDQSITALYSMSGLETELPSASFIRIHKSYIINMEHIHLVEGNCVHIDDQIIPIGASFKKEFFGKLGK